MRSTHLGRPTWQYALNFVIATGIGMFTSWQTHRKVWSWPVMFMWAAFAGGIWLQSRRYRKNLAADHVAEV